MMNTWLVFHEISQPHGAALLMWDLVDLAVRKRTAPSLQNWDIGLWGKRGGEKGKFVGNDIAEVDGWDCLISLPLIPTLLSSTARLLIPFQGVASFFLFYFFQEKEKKEKKTQSFMTPLLSFNPAEGVASMNSVLCVKCLCEFSRVVALLPLNFDALRSQVLFCKVLLHAPPINWLKS